MVERQLVVVWHYEPPEDVVELLRRVFERLLNTTTLERLTRDLSADTIGQTDAGSVNSKRDKR